MDVWRDWQFCLVGNELTGTLLAARKEYQARRGMNVI